MLVTEEEITARYESPLNLLNRLRNTIHSNKSDILSIPPSASDVVQNLEDKLKYGGLKSKAAAIMDLALDELKETITSVKPSDLGKIAEQMNKIVVAQTEDREKVDNRPQIIIHAPSFVSEDHYETIYVKE